MVGKYAFEYSTQHFWKEAFSVRLMRVYVVRRMIFCFSFFGLRSLLGSGGLGVLAGLRERWLWMTLPGMRRCKVSRGMGPEGGDYGFRIVEKPHF